MRAIGFVSATICNVQLSPTFCEPYMPKNGRQGAEAFTTKLS